MYWRYSLAEALTLELKKQSVRKQAGSITINLLELIGMMMSAFVMQITGNDRPEYAGDTVLLRGDNVSAVSWLNRCGGVDLKSQVAGVTKQNTFPASSTY